MTITKEELNQIITTSLVLGYNGRQFAVNESPTEEGREQIMSILTEASLNTFNCPTVSVSAFCKGCSQCLPTGDAPSVPSLIVPN